MLQLEPEEYFTICRQLADPSDTNTYYVKAVIRNAKTDAVLDTVYLEDKGEQRFRKQWQVPADPSGQGFYISITTYVYEDASYSTESPNYEREEDVYLVQKRYNPLLGGGGGFEINYRKVRDIVREELAKLPKVEIPKQKEVDVGLIISEINAVKKAVKGIKIPKQKGVDLSGVKSELDKLGKAINSIEIPEPEKVDFSGIERELSALSDKIERFDKKISATMVDEVDSIRKQIETIKDSLKQGFPLKVVGSFQEQPKTRRFI